MSRQRNKNAMQNTFKDYLVPIIGGVILIILLWSFIGGNNDSSETNTKTIENQNPVNISFENDTTEAFIQYPSDERKQILTGSDLYKGESIIVKDGIVRLEFGNSNTVSLNKVAELKYNIDNSLSLYSSDAWIVLSENTEISMRYANIQAPAGSIISLTQNEASSTIYILDGSAKVTNLAGVSTSMVGGEKLSVSRQFAADEDANLGGDTGPIDSYFKSSDWFIENDGINVLNSAEREISGNNENDSTNGSGASIGETGVFLQFNTINDEGNISSSESNISGTILSENVELITINGKQATISNTGEFNVDGVNTSKSINDLVVKIYDDSRALLNKKVITLYNANPSVSTNTQNVVQATNNVDSNTISSTNSQGVTTFGVDATDFVFTQPSASGKFSTTASEITIRGSTTAENISKVEVNGFELASFNGTTWRYHAFERFETLEAGTNQYKVDYFGENGNIVYTDYYTIVKQDPQPTASPTTENTQIQENATQNSDSNNNSGEIPPEDALFQ